MFVSWNGAQYNCNPRAIAEAIARDTKALESFEPNYAFVNPDKFPDVPAQIHKVEIGSLEYYYLLATSQFIVSNIRFAGIYFPYKKNSQAYIQTMHGGHGIKRVEFDAELSADYVKSALEDTRRTDMMPSDSRYWTNIYRTAYRYTGEVLEVGLPRNDIFFAPNYIKDDLRQQVFETVGLDDENSNIRLLIYTPTFRGNGRRDVYGFNVDNVIQALETRFGGQWHVLISSHPNMRSYYRDIYDFSHPQTHDVGTYPDLQELLVVSDVLITDYSSAEMDFSLTKRPIFQLIRDLADYDRGTYISPVDLPFPYAENDAELVQNILSFDEKKYLSDLEAFNRDIIGLNETGHASEAVIRWMLEKMKS